MRIYGAEISGSLLVSGSAEFQENILVSGSMTVLGGINATISGTITDALVAEMAPKYTLTTSFHDFTSSYNTGSFTGSFKGDGNGLTNIPASGVTGLNLDRISLGSVTASISETNGLRVNTNTEITGTLKVTGEITSNGVGLISGSDQLTSSYDQRYILSGSITETTWDNVENKPSGIVSSSVQVSLTGTTGYSTFSSSIATTDSNQENRLSSLETASGSIRNDFNSYTSSNNSFTSSINTTIKNKLNTDGVISGSVQIDIASTTGYSTFSSSIATTDSNQNSRLNSLEGKTGSYSTTGSNKFVGDQTITGSLTVTQNLTVLGSSSLLIVTSSQLSVSSSTISVNVFEPAERFGGLKVYDSGSSAATASLLWDSLNNKWIYQNATGSGYSGGMLMMGPRNTGSLGDEVGTIANVVMKGQGGDHITGSNITDDGTNVHINSNTIITGSLVVTSTVSSTNITAIETSTSSLNSFTSSINTTIKNKLNTDGVISGSSQILLSSGIWSGSGQLPSGVVSGSSQVLAGTTIHSGSFFNGISVVSGSAQISFGGITGVPAGLVSGSSQITLSSTSGFGTYINQALLTTSSPTFSTVTATTFSGNATTATTAGAVSTTVAASSDTNLLYATIADNDYFRLRVGGASNAGYVEIATADDGTEPIYVRQYTGVFSSLTRTATLLDGSGNTTFPGSVTASSFSGTIAGSNVSGNISGNASNITSYTINQSLGTGNSPTFAGLTIGGNIIPSSNGTYNLGSSSARWNTVFTSDLSMSNGIGDYTIVEGEEDLFIYNNKTNKVFKFLLQEVDPSTAPPKKVH